VRLLGGVAEDQVAGGPVGVGGDLRPVADRPHARGQVGGLEDVEVGAGGGVDDVGDAGHVPGQGVGGVEGGEVVGDLGLGQAQVEGRGAGGEVALGEGVVVVEGLAVGDDVHAVGGRGGGGHVEVVLDGGVQAGAAAGVGADVEEDLEERVPGAVGRQGGDGVA